MDRSTNTRPASPFEKSLQTSLYRFRTIWFGRYARRMNALLIGGALALALLPTRHTFAQTTGGSTFDTAKIVTFVQGAIDTIKLLSAIASVFLIVAGFAVMLFKGVNDSARIKGPQILWGTALGGIGLFFLAVPIANQLLTLAGANGNLIH